VSGGGEEEHEHEHGNGNGNGNGDGTDHGAKDEGSRPGWGKGDDNHEHTGPKK